MVIVRVHQTVKMDNEIPHLGAVDCPLCRLSPGRLRLCKARIDANNVELIQIAEANTLKIFKLAPKNEVKKLLI
tara:strand:+ start:170 stop:391 length:222 start_codon:yes stop_codon:yes gene_type:complete